MLETRSLKLCDGSDSTVYLLDTNIQKPKYVFKVYRDLDIDILESYQSLLYMAKTKIDKPTKSLSGNIESLLGIFQKILNIDTVELNINISVFDKLIKKSNKVVGLSSFVEGPSLASKNILNMEDSSNLIKINDYYRDVYFYLKKINSILVGNDHQFVPMNAKVQFKQNSDVVDLYFTDLLSDIKPYYGLNK